MIAMQGRLSTHDTGIAHYWPPAANPAVGFHSQNFCTIFAKESENFCFCCATYLREKLAQFAQSSAQTSFCVKFCSEQFCGANYQ